MRTLITRPSKKLQQLVEGIHGSANAAAQAWDMPTSTLLRFMEQGIEAPVPMRIAAVTGLSVDDLTVTEER